MGIVLTVLEPPHLPEPKLVAALPPGTGRVIDVEPRLVSPRYDKLLVTSRGLVVRDPVSGNFHGVPWMNFSLDSHLRQHSRHAVLTLWLNERRPLELAITRRLALNIASVAPVLRLHPNVAVDDVVIANHRPEVVDLRDQDPNLNLAPVLVGAAAPQPADRVDGLPPPHPLTEPPAAGPTGSLAVELRRPSPPAPGDWPGPPGQSQEDSTTPRRPLRRVVAGLAVLVLAAVVGGAASMVVNGADGSPAEGSTPTISSQAVETD